MIDSMHEQSEGSERLPIFGGIYGKEEERQKRQKLLICNCYCN